MLWIKLKKEAVLYARTKVELACKRDPRTQPSETPGLRDDDNKYEDEDEVKLSTKQGLWMQTMMNI